LGGKHQFVLSRRFGIARTTIEALADSGWYGTFNQEM